MCVIQVSSQSKHCLFFEEIYNFTRKQMPLYLVWAKIG